jgi:hypothetical protein
MELIDAEPFYTASRLRFVPQPVELVSMLLVNPGRWHRRTLNGGIVIAKNHEEIASGISRRFNLFDTEANTIDRVRSSRVSESTTENVG